MAAASASGPSADAMRTRFELALQEHNFGKRCHLLAALGKELRAAAMPPDRLSQILDALADLSMASGADDAEEARPEGNQPDAEPEGTQPEGGNQPGGSQGTGTSALAAAAFADGARLIVAKAAGCMGYSRKFLAHPSKTVRFAAVRGGLLRETDAREVFLSDDSSWKLKKLLIGCTALPCEEATVNHAWELFGMSHTELVWELLARAQNEELLRSWVTHRGKMNIWLEMQQRKSPPHLPALARRFPTLMVELVKQEVLRWSWYWTKDILQTHPGLVLRAAFLEGCLCGSGPKEGYDPGARPQPIDDTLASWGWRHQPDLMLDICREVALKPGETSVECLASYMMNVRSTRYYLTANQKINYLLSIWSRLPVANKTPSTALSFLDLLPENLHERRKGELGNLVSAFWKILADLGRQPRRDLLVGAEAKPECTRTLKILTNLLPPPLAVEQFFRIVEEFEAADPAYRHIQSEICSSEDGRHDGLMQRVFERYLRKEEASASDAATMFRTLLADAQSRDVIQKSFDLLLQRLGNKMELGLLGAVTAKQLKLERDAAADAASAGDAEAAAELRRKTPAATLPVPTAWAQLVQLPRKAPAHADFMLHVLHSGTSSAELLGSMLAKYGSIFFWDALGVVLEAASGRPKGLLERAPPPVDMDLFRKIDLAGILRPLPSQNAAGGAGGSSGEGVVSVYFAALEETKRKTLGKDASQRQAGYMELVALAEKDVNPTKAFTDLLQFLQSRFKGEQEFVRLQLLDELLKNKRLPVKMWSDSLKYLEGFWHACVKSREASSYSSVWLNVGSFIVRQCIFDWGEEREPTALCAFGMQVAGKVDLPGLFVEAHKQCKDGKTISNAAAKWVFETTVPLSAETGIPIESFWTCLQKMASIVPADRGGERLLWDTWPFVGERWKALLAEGVNQKAIDFAFVGVVDLLTRKSAQLVYKKRKECGGSADLWLVPLECDEYRAVIKSIMQKMESEEIPAKAASDMLARRVRVLMVKEWKTYERDDAKRVAWKIFARARRPRREIQKSPSLELRAETWFEAERWDIPKHHFYTPLDFGTYRCRDSVAALELACLSKILATRKAHRQVLWQIVRVGALLSGDAMAALLGEAVASLDARCEGMARTISRHYPFLCAALSKEETQNGCCDVLTPLVELWLFDDKSREACVAKIMERSDFELFLFFGTSFARHLSNVRQEWLHLCLERLRPPGCGDIEFYHFERRGPLLRQVAQLGSGYPGWRTTLAKESCGQWGLSSSAASKGKGGGKGKVKGKIGKGRMGKATGSSKKDVGPGSVQMHLWHPATQKQFVEKALRATDSTTLALINRAPYVDGIARMKQLLDQYPKEQTMKVVGTDLWGWEVIQAAGAYSDIEKEIERRFGELPAPWLCDAITDPEVETALWSMGRADLTVPALRQLGRFAGKMNNVKHSVTKLIEQVSPREARPLIKKIMLPRKAGVALQTAGLELLGRLRIPDTLELYQTAWSNGKCPRDVAASILATVNTSRSFSPEDVRSFFGFFQEMAGQQQEECIYVAGLLLNQLIETREWALPFLPEVVANLAMLPSLTDTAVSALSGSSSHPTKVVEALTKILRAARLAARTRSSSNDRTADGPEAQVLRDLAQVTRVARCRDIALSVRQKQLQSCEVTTIQDFVNELLLRWKDAQRTQDANADSLLDCALAVWVKLLRPEQPSTWADVLSSMRNRLARQGKLRDLNALGKIVAEALPQMATTSAAVSAQELIAQQLAVASKFFEQLLDEHMATADAQQLSQKDLDRKKAAKELLMDWAELLANGCSQKECEKLFARIPREFRLDVAQKIIQKVVRDCSAKEAKLAKFRQKRPEDGWRHDAGMPVDQVKVGSKVDGVVTNSSSQFGVFFNFGCERDGKLNVPADEWSNYRVGDEVKGMVVNKVDITQKNSFIELIIVGDRTGKVESSFAGWNVASQTLKWLSSPPEERSLHFAALAKLWAQVVALACNSLGFDGSLQLLGEPEPAPEDCTLLVEEMLREKPSRAFSRAALTWLGKISPDDAVRLWPTLLEPRHDEAAEVEDVQALLALCESNGLELPEIRPQVARRFSGDVLDTLSASKLSEGRLLLVLALEEQLCKSEALPSVLTSLQEDACEVVKVAARRLSVSLTEPDKNFKDGGRPEPDAEDDSGSESNLNRDPSEEDDDMSGRGSEGW
eukprot:TRINITY_DN5907_c0_g2_i1.p1 TRINITY_DN5907_c0_g2~~TRINITY_DN5907_c0_g2_i1.p1  ORF type:complete len:2178 (-),score=479.83 TRINITY_DN5907_c0_g2_i1:18-6551(-)